MAAKKKTGPKGSGPVHEHNKLIREFREALGKTAQDLAVDLGVAISSIFRWEKADKPDPEILVKMANMAEDRGLTARCSQEDEVSAARFEDIESRLRYLVFESVGFKLKDGEGAIIFLGADPPFARSIRSDSSTVYSLASDFDILFDYMGDDIPAKRGVLRDIAKGVNDYIEAIRRQAADEEDLTI